MKLYRPTIPVEVKCRVVLRQLGEMWPERVINDHRTMPGRLGRLLKSRLELYASMIRCEVSDLRLDHDPPLGARPKHRRGLGRKTFYIPDANDPEHLFYRSHASHLIKTNVRGDGAQYPDRVLIKRERRRQRRTTKKKRPMRAWSRRLKMRWPPSRKIPSRKKR